jgi:hypothetical protein
MSFILHGSHACSTTAVVLILRHVRKGPFRYCDEIGKGCPCAAHSGVPNSGYEGCLANVRLSKQRTCGLFCIALALVSVLAGNGVFLHVAFVEVLLMVC